ncbi:YARHG domain-containing protein [Anaeromicropila herbilytica]|uniref:YARHG domain-containing protein n=1 Tax=Anaeromicropila herbilytica TaxID=2785025 RepID=A0A7R7EN68_9FIRM|nr:YARHG domain-containing protein [Anaeromicropila herbilytica]BCN31607.1 hypothetical protein bsdtb5_29020 [Anaeromicropila herbilytica]
MKEKADFKLKIISCILSIAIIFIASITALLFLSSSNVSKAKKTKNLTKSEYAKESDNSSNSQTEEYQGISLDDFSISVSSSNSDKKKETTEPDTSTETKTSEDTEDTEDSSNQGDYIISDSDSRYLTDDDLKDLSKDELSLARNEIFARHGYIFDSEELQSYFEAKDWYSPVYSSDSFPEDELNEYEKKNANLIKDYEKDKGDN